MANAVRRLAGDPELRARLSRNASRVAREKFDRDLLSQAMRAALESAVESRWAQTKPRLAS